MKKTAHISPRVSSLQDSTVCLVAGGAGLVGSYLCESLLGQNCFVYCLDNFSTGREANVEKFKQHPSFQLLSQDLVTAAKLKLPRPIDYIFHVAGVEAYLNGLDVSLETLLVNSFGTKTLLELARENRAKFLLASSEQVYQGFVSEKNLSVYFGENRTLEGENAFAEAKRFAEALTFEYVKKYQVNARIVRLDFLYGPRMNLESGSIIAKLFASGLRRGVIQIPGNGLTRLYPTFITDAIYGLVKAMFSQSSKGRIYNLINPSMVTILNFAYFLRDQLGQGTKIEFIEGEDLYNFDFPQKSVLDSQELLGWYPKVGAKEGIGATLDWFEKSSSTKTLLAEPSLLEKPAPAVSESTPKIEETKPLLPPRKKLNKENKPKTATMPVVPETAKPPLPTSGLPSFITRVTGAKPVTVAQEKGPVVKTPIKEESKEKGADVSLKGVFVPKYWHSLLPRLHWLVIGLCLIIIATTFPLAVFAGLTYRGVRALGYTQEAISKGEIGAVGQFSHKATNDFHRAALLLRSLSWLTARIGLKQQVVFADRSLQVGEYLSESLNSLSKAGETGQALIAIIIGKEVGDPAQKLQTLQTTLAEANLRLGFAEAELDNVYSQLAQVSNLGVGKQIQELKTGLPAWRSGITEAERVLNLLPGILQFRDKQTYLILLQNNQELRPTGGFIGSFALLTLEKGKVLDLRVEDIYAADGQLRGFVTPPEPIKRYLGEEIWWFRDSNISPDFPTSAARAAWFLQKEMNQEVAGVIGLNLQLVQNLLEATGPVYLSDYQEQITAENVFERAEYHAEVNFFPGSTQKKDFLGSLARALFENLKQMEPEQLVKLGQVIIRSLNEKALMVWLPGTTEAKLLSQYGWDGALRTPPEVLPEFGKVDLSDYLMPVEANFGVNKANYFIKRKSQQEVSILKDGRIMEKYTLTLGNSSPSTAWPGGNYKNYLRLYLPSDTHSEIVTIRKAADKDGDKLRDKDIEVTQESGKRVVGFLVEVPPKEERIVTVEYRREKKFPINQPQTTYLFYWQKQSGIGADPVMFIFNYPMFLKPVKLSQEVTHQNQSLQFKTDLSQDRLFAITLSH